MEAPPAWLHPGCSRQQWCVILHPGLMRRSRQTIQRKRQTIQRVRENTPNKSEGVRENRKRDKYIYIDRERDLERSGDSDENPYINCEERRGEERRGEERR